MRKTGQLELNEALKAQKAMWRFQRAGLTLMVLMILGAAVGYLAPGSEKSARDPELEVRYQSTLHVGTPTRLTARLLSPSSSPFTLELAKTYLDAFRIQDVVPEPLRIREGEKSLIFEFEADPGVSPKVIFDLEPRQWGRAQGRVKAVGANVEFRQIVFP